jgi:hypothetical protein
MKTLIGTAVGAMALGGILVATTHSSTSSSATPGTVAGLSGQAAADSAQQPVLINCGEGRQPVVHSTMVNGQTVSRVECGQATRFDPFEAAPQVQPQALTAPALAPAAMPVAQPQPVRTRVVYRDRPVYRQAAAQAAPARSTSPVYRSTGRGTSTVASNGDYGGYRSEPVRREPRSWKKSAVIIGGSAAGGAAVGAVLGGGGGAKKGAVLGGVAGTIYDIATRNKR